MKAIKTSITDLILIQPDVFPDERGYFFESFQKEKFSELGIEADFVQDNESMSVKGVLRGLHIQVPPFAQGKLVRVVSGSVLDVAVGSLHSEHNFHLRVNPVDRFGDRLTIYQVDCALN